MKQFFLWMIICLGNTFIIRGQTESVYLHMDKAICYPGDTCWFAGYVFDNNQLSHYSKNLIVELFEDKKLISRKIFPLMNGLGMGQLTLPKKTGMYWIRSYTNNSSFFIHSITIRNADVENEVRNLLDYTETPVLSETPFYIINSIYTAEGISCTFFPNDSISSNFDVKLCVSYYDKKIVEWTNHLRQHQYNIIISKDSLEHIHGYVTLTFYHADTILAQQELFVPQTPTLVEMIRDTGGYVLKIKDSMPWNFSIAVSKLGETMMGNGGKNISHCLSPIGTRLPSDTSYLQYAGVVTKQNRLRDTIKNNEIVMMVGKDSVNQASLIPIDSFGNISFSNLYFFDSTYLLYALNGYPGDRVNDINIQWKNKIYPNFDLPKENDYELNLFSIPSTLVLPKLDTLKYLKPVYVEASYKKALDNRYTTGRFSWPAHFKYDLIHANKYNYSILDYLNIELPWFGSDVMGIKAPVFKNHPVIFYLDEELINWHDLTMLYIHDLVYVKVIEDFVEDDRYIRMVSGIDDDVHPNLKDPYGTDNSPSAMICIYRRKGKDLRGIDSELCHSIIQGYDRPLLFSNSDRTTNFWIPYIHGNEFHIPFIYKENYILVAEGVNEIGKTFHFERKLD